MTALLALLLKGNTAKSLAVGTGGGILALILTLHADVKGEIKQDVGVVDVAVTALYHLGIPAKEAWNLDGRVAGL